MRLMPLRSSCGKWSEMNSLLSGNANRIANYAATIQTDKSDTLSPYWISIIKECKVEPATRVAAKWSWPRIRNLLWNQWAAVIWCSKSICLWQTHEKYAISTPSSCINKRERELPLSPKAVYVSLAQQVELATLNREVQGSSPWGRTNNNQRKDDEHACIHSGFGSVYCG